MFSSCSFLDYNIAIFLMTRHADTLVNLEKDVEYASVCSLSCIVFKLYLEGYRYIPANFAVLITLISLM